MSELGKDARGHGQALGLGQDEDHGTGGGGSIACGGGNDGARPECCGERAEGGIDEADGAAVLGQAAGEQVWGWAIGGVPDDAEREASRCRGIGGRVSRVLRGAWREGMSMICG